MHVPPSVHPATSATSVCAQTPTPTKPSDPLGGGATGSTGTPRVPTSNNPGALVPTTFLGAAPPQGALAPPSDLNATPLGRGGATGSTSTPRVVPTSMFAPNLACRCPLALLPLAHGFLCLPQVPPPRAKAMSNIARNAPRPTRE